VSLLPKLAVAFVGGVVMAGVIIWWALADAYAEWKEARA